MFLGWKHTLGLFDGGTDVFQYVCVSELDSVCRLQV